jgi:hypothetical protein
MLAMEISLVLRVLCPSATQLRSCAEFVVSLQRHGDICSTPVLTRAQGILPIKCGLTRGKVGFSILAQCVQ